MVAMFLFYRFSFAVASAPLAALATNSSAGLRWLAQEPPDLDEARANLREALELRAHVSAGSVNNFIA